MRKKLILGLGLAAILGAALLATVALNQSRNNSGSLISQSSTTASEILSSKVSVKSLADESFGNLDPANLKSLQTKNESLASSEAGLKMPAMPLYAEGQEPSLNSSLDQKMIAPGEPYPQPMSYAFKYQGDEITGLPEMQSVYKRVINSQSNNFASQLTSILGNGLVNFSKLQKPSINNFSIAENREYGYIFDVDYLLGSIRAYSNFNLWPQLCANPECVYPTITKETFPSDEKLLSIAASFVQEYGINLESYGQPFVANMDTIDEPMPMPATSGRETGAEFYYPRYVNVVYPLIINGQEVVDESGNLSGLNIGIDLLHNKVTNADEITSKQFQQSNYAAETDSSRVIKVAERGGFRNYVSPDTNNTTVKTLLLGTPTFKLVIMWYSTPQTFSSSDSATSMPSDNSPIYVPSLVFPITNNDGQYWSNHVVVPLIKDMLDSDNFNQPMPIEDGPAVRGPDVKQAM